MLRRRRALWSLIGLILGAAGVLAIYLQRSSGVNAARQASSPPQATALEDPLPPTDVILPQQCYLGVVLARETTDVVAASDGRILEIDVFIGDEVTRHQRLAILDSEALDHQLTIERAGLATAEAEQRRIAVEVERAEQELRRRMALGDLISEQEKESSTFQLEGAKAQLEVANAELAQIRARIEQLEMRREQSKIRAPFDGKVALRYLDAGAVVTTGTPIVRLISSAGLLTRFAVPAEQAAAITVNLPVRIEIETSRIVARGVVEHISPEIDAASQMVVVEARIETGEGFPVGAIARVSAAGSEDSPSCLASRG